MNNTYTIGFIGAGNMAMAIISGLIKSNFSPNNIKASSTNKASLIQAQKEFNIETFASNSDLVEKCEVVVLAVKPQILNIVCKKISKQITTKHLIISVAAGAKVASIQNWLGTNVSVVRTMPNAPALIRQGATGLYADKSVSTQQRSVAEQILGAVGICIWVRHEDMLNAITAISGSGPVYFFFMLEAITEAGTELGMNEKLAQKLSIQTALGASMLATENKDSLQKLRQNICSHGGTTEAAINTLKQHNFTTCIKKAIQASFKRAHQIGDELK